MKAGIYPASDGSAPKNIAPMIQKRRQVVNKEKCADGDGEQLMMW